MATAPTVLSLRLASLQQTRYLSAELRIMVVILKYLLEQDLWIKVLFVLNRYLMKKGLEREESTLG